MSAISSVGASSSEIRTDYLNLLVTQLRNQNPLEPLSNNEMASQLAQLSQLEQLEGISSTFQKVLMSTQLSQARDLIGKVVSFVPQGQDQEYWGRVDSAEVVDGGVRLWIGDYPLELSDIRSIRDYAGLDSSATDQLAEATALIGKEITFLTSDASGQQVQVVGRVDSVIVSDGQALLTVGQNNVKLREIQAVRN